MEELQNPSRYRDGQWLANATEDAMTRPGAPTTKEPDADTRVAFIAGAIGLVWVAALALGLLGGVVDLTFVVLAAAAPIALVYGVRRYRPAGRRPWIVMTTALVLFLIGGGLRQSFDTLGDLSTGRSLVPDLVTIPGYLMLGVALAGIARMQRGGRRDVDGLLDGLIAGLAAWTLAWIYLVDPALFHAEAPLPVRLVLSSYPALSAFLVVITARIGFGSGRRIRQSAAFRLLFGAMTMLFVGDTLFMIAETADVSIPTNLLAVPYALTYVAAITLMLHPSMRLVTEPLPVDETTQGRGRLAFVAIALVIPALVAVTRVNEKPSDRIALATIVIALTAAAVWRMLRAIRGFARSEATLAHRATHDSLTGLPNRAYVQDSVDRSLSRLQLGDGGTAVFFLDIDRFKLVNDSHGHGLGDEYLVAVARRLTSTTDSGTLIARVGGDEFVIVIEGLRSLESALEFGERVRLSFRSPFLIRGAEIASSVSVGIAYTNGRDGWADAETLMRNADTAMYQAKDAGRDAVTVFDDSMRNRAAQRLELEADLRHALERDELHLHYQPVVRLDDGTIEGFEALLRWSHPTRGQIPPVVFIPVAEDTGLITAIGAWVTEEACRQLARWRKILPNGRSLRMSVNLSARQFRDPDLVGMVRRALDASALPGNALCLELTESLLMANGARAADELTALRSLGVQLSIDDFGTGYSSLAYLRRFQVDEVKIDRSFVDGLDHDDSPDETLVAAIIAMAKALNIATVAEGVETLAQAERLVRQGCPTAQGYYFSRPVPADQMPEVAERLGVARAHHLGLVRDETA